MKILFPTDGSDASLAALRHLVARVRWFSGAPQITLVNVHLPLPYARAVAWAGKEAVHDYYEEESNEAIAPASALLKEAGIAHDTVRRVGEPSAEIVAFAAEWNAELIAMGRQGHSAIATLLLGSVTQKVLAIATVPVLILPSM